MIRQGLKLNIGCGLTAPSGWVNIDSSLNARLAKLPWFRRMLAILHIIPLDRAKIPYPKNIYVCDVSRSLPFAESSVEVIYCSHFLEHLKQQDALFFMEECHRVLSSSGIIRIIVPDLALLIEQYIKRVRQGNREALINELPSDIFLEDLCILDKESTNENIFLRLYKKIMGDKNTHKWIYDEYSLTALLLKYGFDNIRRKACYESSIKDIEKLDNLDRFNGAVCLEAEKP